MVPMLPKDFKTDVWKRFEVLLRAREAALLDELRSTGLDERKTQIIRGRLAENAKYQALAQAPAMSAASQDALDPFVRTMNGGDVDQT